MSDASMVENVVLSQERDRPSYALSHYQQTSQPYLLETCFKKIWNLR
jgi:hypothetical protein